MPFPLGGLESLYIDADDYFSGHDVGRKKEVNLELMRRLESKLGHRGILLDVGCGRGELLWAAREAGWQYKGIDPSAVYLDSARRSFGIEAQVGTIEEAHFPDNYFDAITMGGIIEHLYEPYRTLQEVWRVLKPGGYFYFDAPNEDALYTRIGNLYMRARGRDWVLNLAPTFPPYHVQGFNQHSLCRLLERVGFEVEQLKMCGSISPPTGESSLRKRLEHRVAKLINWIGNCCGAGVYMDVWTRKPES